MPTDNEDMEVENIEEEVVDNAQEEQEVQNEKQLTQEDIDNAVKSRVGRVERKYKRELAEKDNELEELRQLKSTLRKGLELNEDDNVLEKVNSFYKEQGVDIPQFESSTNKRDTQRLGELDAQDLIGSADFDEIQNRANELNKKYYVGEDKDSNPNATTSSELAFKDLTLIKIKNGKIVKYLETLDTIKTELGI